MSLSARRAWIEIRLADMSAAWNRLSLSARRAWIEIEKVLTSMYMYGVALRKESVDRNAVGSWPLAMNPSSLSARRAWIEINDQNAGTSYSMSLSARRAWIEILFCLSFL